MPALHRSRQIARRQLDSLPGGRTGNGSGSRIGTGNTGGRRTGPVRSVDSGRRPGQRRRPAAALTDVSALKSSIRLTAGGSYRHAPRAPTVRGRLRQAGSGRTLLPGYRYSGVIGTQNPDIAFARGSELTIAFGAVWEE